MEQSNKGLAIASLILGIIGLLTSFFCMCFMPFIAPFLGIPGLVLGIIGIRKKEGGMAIAGTILSSITLTLSIIFMIFWGLAFLADGSNFFSNMFDPYYY